MTSSDGVKSAGSCKNCEHPIELIIKLGAKKIYQHKSQNLFPQGVTRCAIMIASLNHCGCLNPEPIPPVTKVGGILGGSL